MIGGQGKTLLELYDLGISAKPAFHYDRNKAHTLVTAVGRDRIGFIQQVAADSSTGTCTSGNPVPDPHLNPHLNPNPNPNRLPDPHPPPGRCPIRSWARRATSSTSRPTRWGATS